MKFKFLHLSVIATCFLTFFAVTMFSTTSAQASCITNPAICKAICGCSCCDNFPNCGGGFKAKTGAQASRALSRFSTAVLRRQLKAIKRNTRTRRIIAAELKKRSRLRKR